MQEIPEDGAIHHFRQTDRPGRGSGGPPVQRKRHKPGHIVRRIYPHSVTRQRRKLKKLRHLLNNGEMLPDDVYNSFQSWDSHATRFDTWRTRQSMRNLFAQLFPEIVEAKRYETYLEFERQRQKDLETIWAERQATEKEETTT